ncbi:hypothetical protein VT84_17805 [Gemmata sp. SH-PL17]|uniref:hypothetical protein n=1 Tax=Gemmata sp. SH-PL17 TaxID=1630693 RepID=UPI00078E7F1C|nr:hypothetical protein [Gemmata sp. SH-PL17]AMV26258.1 hypothetical protein VT84_17805 [Gemmata sp. SH-PL17]
MARQTLLALGACFVLTVGTATAAPTDVADVFPPNTLAYAELHNPAELGPQLAAVFKGTPLEDSIPFIHGKKDGAKTLAELKAKQELAQLALLMSPEVLGEFRKLGGVAVGLIGFNERGDPELAVAVLTGDSAAAGLAARAFVTTSQDLRRVGEVGKVPVFQHRAPATNYDPSSNPKLATDKLVEGTYEPTFAYVPGLFVAGTSKTAIAPIIARFRGDEKDSLRATEGFKTSAPTYRKPGLFFYANAPEFFTKLDAAARLRGAPMDLDFFAWLKLVTNPKALKTVAGCVQFRDGGSSLVIGTRFDPAQKSPLLDAFSGPAVKIDALHHARKPASFAATMNLPEKDRAAAVLSLLDALAKGSGELGRLPSDVVKDLDAKYKMSVSDTVLAKIRAITVIVPTKQDLAKGAKPIPMFVVHAEDADAATELEAFVPKLIAEIAGEKDAAQPSTETTGDVKILSLAGTSLPWKAAVHYARKDSVLVWGLDRKLVAAATAPDAANSVAGNNKEAPLPSGGLALVGTLNIGDLVASFETKPVAGGPVRPVEPLRLPPGGGNVAVHEALQKDVEKARVAFQTSLSELPPALLTAQRTGDELRFELFQPKVQNGGLAPLVSAGMDWFDKLMSMRDPNQMNSGYYPPGRFPR